MKGTIGLFLLAIGIVISASFGARNGAQHVAYRQAVAEVELAEDADVEAAKAARDRVGLPAPEKRLQEWFQVAGLGWMVGLGFIVVGAVLSRMQLAEENSGEGMEAHERVDFVTTLVEVRARLAKIKEQIATLPMDGNSDQPREVIDAIGTELLEPLVDARGQLVAKHGMGGFAEYFGTFSAAERNLNRCWSALTDGHAVVARQALESSDRSFEAAIAQYVEVDGRA